MNHRIDDKDPYQSVTEPSNNDHPEDHEAPLAFSNQKPLQTGQSPLVSENNMPDVVLSMDNSSKIVTANQAVEAYGFKVEDLVGTFLADFVHPDDRDRITTSFMESLAKREDHVHAQQFRVLSESKQVFWIEAKSNVRFTPDGELISWESICRDITGNLQSQNTLLKAWGELEEQVKFRTDELMRANVELRNEILERRNKEQQLMERESDLEMEKANLQETNTALKVLLKQRDSDKHVFEEQVMYNVKELILPYLDKLKATNLDARQEAYLSILETNLSDVTSAFSRRLSLEFHGLTTSELKVANFIRQGKKTREIASLLGLSRRTIDAYRQSIRRKLRINNKKANLRTLLMSMQ